MMSVVAAMEKRTKLAIMVASTEVSFGPPTSRMRMINMVGVGEPGS